MKLPLEFDVERLKADLQTANEYEWINHINTRIYDGDWQAVPLRSVDGRIDSIAAVSIESAEYQNTELLKRCPYFQQVINSLDCETTAVRLITMTPGTKVKRHDDYPCRFSSGHVRLHVPVMTNPDVEIFIDDEPVFFGEGECWYMNAEYPHSLENNGKTPRVHMVIDCTVNSWLEKMFIEAGHTEPVANNKYMDPAINDDNVEDIIYSLEQQGNPTALEMAANLKKLSKCDN